MKLHLSFKFSLKRSVAFAALLGLVAYFVWTYHAITSQAERDEAQAADAIVVFGAAEYSGKPSPVYRARLEHAYFLFSRGLAPYIITSGGAGDSKFSEGAVGRDFLVGMGVPESHLIAETTANDTADSAARVANIMRSNGMRSCIAVSDGYHLYRIKQLMAAQGVETYASPRPDVKPLPVGQRVVQQLREVLSLTLWRLNIT